MRRPAFILLFLCLVLGLNGSTVMIYTIDAWFSEEDRQGEDYIVFTLEDGLMESLFDNGHIIYNDYAMPLTEPDYGDRDRIALRLARSGGADYLVELNLEYEKTGDRKKQALPKIIEFRLSYVPEAEALLDGTLFTQDYLTERRQSNQEICTRLGREVANKILGYIGQEQGL